MKSQLAPLLGLDEGWGKFCNWDRLQAPRLSEEESRGAWAFWEALRQAAAEGGPEAAEQLAAGAGALEGPQRAGALALLRWAAEPPPAPREGMAFRDRLDHTADALAVELQR